MARKNDSEEVLMDDAEGDAAEVRVYELSFHIDPELSESDAKRAYESIKEVAEKGGSIVAEGEPEKFQLAYTIRRTETTGRRDFDTSYFAWIAYETNGAGHDAVTEAAKAEKRVIRFLDIRTTKDLAKYSAEMRELRERAPEKPAGEEVSDTELDAALEGASA
ncbi:MAG TPA: 30S ribosomal protein S6 [Candidatus Paceibacterota bacterium]|nr:30S ribosomal protein S6 [Candidatus Paceibacterota bacterium]